MSARFEGNPIATGNARAANIKFQGFDLDFDLDD
jgi:hypothetical protein